jgi:hypothetical protein
VRRFFAVFVGGLGLGALLRRRRRRSVTPEPESSPANELREKLAESRAAEAEHAEAPPQDDDVSNRRRALHEQTRSSIDELSS